MVALEQSNEAGELTGTGESYFVSRSARLDKK